MDLKTSLDTFPGIGPARAKALKKLGLETREGLAITGLRASIGKPTGPNVALIGELDGLACPTHPMATDQGFAHSCGHYAQIVCMLGAAMALTDPAVLLPMVYLCVMATTVALLFQNVGQVWSDPASASVILSLESVFGVLCSVLFAGDQVSGRMLAGFALIFVAVVCSETKFSFLRKNS